MDRNPGSLRLSRATAAWTGVGRAEPSPGPSTPNRETEETSDRFPQNYCACLPWDSQALAVLLSKFVPSERSCHETRLTSSSSKQWRGTETVDRAPDARFALPADVRMPGYARILRIQYLAAAGWIAATGLHGLWRNGSRVELSTDQWFRSQHARVQGLEMPSLQWQWVPGLVDAFFAAVFRLVNRLASSEPRQGPRETGDPR